MGAWRLALAVLGLACLVTAGCLGTSPNETGPNDESNDTAPDAGPQQQVQRMTLSTECGSCFEPTVATGPSGTVFVTDLPSESIWTVVNGTVSSVDKPPLPPGASPTADRADDTVDVAPNGSLFFHALINTPGEGPLQPAGLVGIQVARSDDGGRTWATNAFVGLPLDSRDAPAAVSDRQWLAADDEGNVYLTYSGQNLFGAWAGIHVVQSSDGGQSWGDWSLAVPHERAGAIAVDGEGRPLIAYGASADETPGPHYDRVVRVASSSDGGETWTSTTVARLSDERVVGSPDVALQDRRPTVTWTRSDDTIRQASGDADLSAFEQPSSAGTAAGTVREGPSIATHDGVADTIWFDETDEGVRLQLARTPLGGNATSLTVALSGAYDAAEDGETGQAVGSDFTDLAVSDGRPVTAWTTGEELRLAYGPPVDDR